MTKHYVMSDAAKQTPERKRVAGYAAAPDGVGPVAYARGSDRGSIRTLTPKIKHDEALGVRGSRHPGGCPLATASAATPPDELGAEARMPISPGC